jgi:hypothetical protein
MVGTRQRNTAGLFSVDYKVNFETNFTSTGEETDDGALWFRTLNLLNVIALCSYDSFTISVVAWYTTASISELQCMFYCINLPFCDISGGDDDSRQ